jgi:hypothetical protein
MGRWFICKPVSAGELERSALQLKDYWRTDGPGAGSERDQTSLLTEQPPLVLPGGYPSKQTACRCLHDRWSSRLTDSGVDHFTRTDKTRGKSPENEHFQRQKINGIGVAKQSAR